MTPIIINEWMYDRGRGPELRSCRITVNDLFPYLQHESYDDAQMLELWPVTQEELNALKQYIQDHYEDVKEVNRRVDERIAREMAEQAKRFSGPEFVESRKRFQALKAFVVALKENASLFEERPGESNKERLQRMKDTAVQWFESESSQPLQEVA